MGQRNVAETRHHADAQLSAPGWHIALWAVGLALLVAAAAVLPVLLS